MYIFFSTLLQIAGALESRSSTTALCQASSFYMALNCSSTAMFLSYGNSNARDLISNLSDYAVGPYGKSPLGRHLFMLDSHA